MQKLHRFCINNDVITWVGSFLSNRTKRDVLEGEESNTCPVMSCVPQGSVLGPCLLILYVNYILDMIESKIRLIADDTIMNLTFSKREIARQIFQNLKPGRGVVDGV